MSRPPSFEIRRRQCRGRCGLLAVLLPPLVAGCFGPSPEEALRGLRERAARSESFHVHLSTQHWEEPGSGRLCHTGEAEYVIDAVEPTRSVAAELDRLRRPVAQPGRLDVGIETITVTSLGGERADRLGVVVAPGHEANDPALAVFSIGTSIFTASTPDGRLVRLLRSRCPPFDPAAADRAASDPGLGRPPGFLHDLVAGADRISLFVPTREYDARAGTGEAELLELPPADAERVRQAVPERATPRPASPAFLEEPAPVTLRLDRDGSAPRWLHVAPAGLRFVDRPAARRDAEFRGGFLIYTVPLPTADLYDRLRALQPAAAE